MDKNVRDKAWDKLESDVNSSKSQQRNMTWCHSMAKRYYNFLLKCEPYEEARNMMENSYQRDLEETKRIVQENANEDITTTATASSSSHVVLDPDRAKTKGRSRRKKSQLPIQLPPPSPPPPNNQHLDPLGPIRPPHQQPLPPIPMATIQPPLTRHHSTITN